MSQYFENPFANYGSIVWGNRFIGRQEGLRVVENRVICPSEPGNLAIVGSHRIGKSSLVYKAVIEPKETLLIKRILPIWINVATCDQALSFFRLLVTRTLGEMREIGCVDDTIATEANYALEPRISWAETYTHIQRFFTKVRQQGYRIVFVLDEFDQTRYLFREEISGFQALRDLSYYPEWRVTYVTTSRRSLRNIESQVPSISNLALIFQTYYLGMFSREDVERYFERLVSARVEVTPLLKKRVCYYCGGHPYLLDVLGYEMVEQSRGVSNVDVDEAARRVEHAFFDYYEHIVSILQEDGMLSKLLQILFGPVVDVNQSDIDELLRYGLIQPSEDGGFVAFSGHFQDYLRFAERQIDLWPIWKETEVALRRVVASKMSERYGERWVEELERIRPKLKPIFDSCREVQQREIRSFGERASRNLIDFTYPQDLFAIIFAEWDVFREIFGKDKNYWNQRAELLAKVRNPLAHNREHALYDYERQLAEGYCKEILERLQGVG